MDDSHWPGVDEAAAKSAGSETCISAAFPGAAKAADDVTIHADQTTIVAVTNTVTATLLVNLMKLLVAVDERIC